MNQLKMNWNLTKSELKINFEFGMNIHMNEVYLSCENDVCDTQCTYYSFENFHHFGYLLG